MRTKQTVHFKNKRQKHSHKEKTYTPSFDDVDDQQISSDDDHQRI